MSKENISDEKNERIQRCFCQKYSCEQGIEKRLIEGTEDQYEYFVSDNFRCRLEKNENGAICGGEKTSGSIESCRTNMDQLNIPYSNKPIQVRKTVENSPQNNPSEKSTLTRKERKHKKHNH